MSTPIRRILIVDDHDAIRRGIRQLLEVTPYYQVVGEAEDGQAALELAITTRPDIAIIDFALPLLNGVDLSKELRRELPRVEILMYTMHDQEALVIDVFRAGVRAFVLKSDPEENLIAALDALSIHRSYFSMPISDKLVDQIVGDKPNSGAGILTGRERQVVQQVSEGHTNKEVAQHLGVSIKTVETHRGNAMRKLCMRTPADLVRYALRNNLVRP